MKQFKVNQNEAGQRFDKLLFKLLNKAPKSFIYKMLRKKNIVLNDKRAKGSEQLKVNDDIKIYFSDETFNKFSQTINKQNLDLNLDIIYEDKHILIVNKPLGMLSQKADKQDVSMVEYLISYLIDTKQLSHEDLKTFRPGVCNRLDRNTSGLLIAGKSLVGLQEISRLLRENSLEKYYLCIVKGNIKTSQRIEGYLKKDTIKNKVHIWDTKSDDADFISTEYIPIKHSQNYTFLKVRLITGRTHQIRAHLASVNHPIIGDFKYGDRQINKVFKNKYKLNHQLLHSYSITFCSIEGELSYLSNKEIRAEKFPDMFSYIYRDLFDSRT